MNSDIYSKAIDIINNRRLAAKSENEKHFAEIETKIPEIREINHILAQTSVNLIKVISSGTKVNEKIKTLEKQNRQAQEMITTMIVQNGYPHDYLDIKYKCSRCADTGFFEGKRCSCLDDLIGKLSVQQLNSHSQVKLCSFETFDLSYYKGVQTSEDSDCYKTMSNNFDYCKRYVDSFSTASKNIFIAGKTGLGKTHLSLAIAEKLLTKGWNILYDSTINYLMQIEKEHFGRSDGSCDTLQILINADLLILDDLGSEYETSFYTSTVYNIINSRLNKGVPTIISTNLSPVEIEKKYEARIVSRLFAMYEYLKFTGKDVRTIKAAKTSKETINYYKANSL